MSCRLDNETSGRHLGLVELDREAQSFLLDAVLAGFVFRGDVVVAREGHQPARGWHVRLSKATSDFPVGKVRDLVLAVQVRARQAEAIPREVGDDSLTIVPVEHESRS